MRIARSIRKVVFFALIAAAVTPVAAKDVKSPLPSEARAVIQAVAASAAKTDLKRIRSAMTNKFTWSFGGDSDAEQAIAEWTKEPRYLRELERVLRSGCRNVASDRIECPGRGNLGFRAGFMKIDGTWRMDYFVEGD